MSDCEYCDDDRAYIRPPRKTETFSISYNSSQPKMNIFKKYLAESPNVSHQDQGKHTVYWMTYDEFAGLPIKKWKKNRPCYEERVTYIRNGILERKRVDGMIYVASIDGELVCYESNHRREALKGLEGKGIHNILVDVLWDATDEEVEQEFRRINDAASVSDLYVEPNPTITVEELRPVVDEFCNRFKPHLKPSTRPQRPDFSRDMIERQFYDACKELQIKPTELIERIARLNTRMTERDKSKLSAKVIEKCTKTGLWLFASANQICAKDLV